MLTESPEPLAPDIAPPMQEPFRAARASVLILIAAIIGGIGSAVFLIQVQQEIGQWYARRTGSLPWPNVDDAHILIGCHILAGFSFWIYFLVRARASRDVAADPSWFWHFHIMILILLVPSMSTEDVSSAMFLQTWLYVIAPPGINLLIYWSFYLVLGKLPRWPIWAITTVYGVLLIISLLSK